jgi:hypothetical protein
MLRENFNSMSGGQNLVANAPFIQADPIAVSNNINTQYASYLDDEIKILDGRTYINGEEVPNQNFWQYQRDVLTPISAASLLPEYAEWVDKANSSAHIDTQDQNFVDNLKSTPMTDLQRLDHIRDHTAGRMRYQREDTEIKETGQDRLREGITVREIVQAQIDAEELPSYDDVVRNRFVGDCDDYATHMYHLARQSGIPADQAYVGAGGITYHNSRTNEIQSEGHAVTIYIDPKDGQYYMMDMNLDEPVKLNYNQDVGRYYFTGSQNGDVIHGYIGLDILMNENGVKFNSNSPIYRGHQPTTPENTSTPLNPTHPNPLPVQQQALQPSM